MTAIENLVNVTIEKYHERELWKKELSLSDPNRASYKHSLAYLFQLIFDWGVWDDPSEYIEDREFSGVLLPVLKLRYKDTYLWLLCVSDHAGPTLRALFAAVGTDPPKHIPIPQLCRVGYSKHNHWSWHKVESMEDVGEVLARHGDLPY